MARRVCQIAASAILFIIAGACGGSGKAVGWSESLVQALGLGSRSSWMSRPVSLRPMCNTDKVPMRYVCCWLLARRGRERKIERGNALKL